MGSRGKRTIRRGDALHNQIVRALGLEAPTQRVVAARLGLHDSSYSKLLSGSMGDDRALQVLDSLGREITIRDGHVTLGERLAQHSDEGAACRV